MSGSAIANKYSLQEINQIIYNVFLTTNSIKFVCELVGANTYEINYQMQILENNIETVSANYDKVQRDFILLSEAYNISYLDIINMFMFNLQLLTIPQLILSVLGKIFLYYSLLLINTKY